MGRKAAYLIRPGNDGKILKKHPSRYHTFLYLSFPYGDYVLATIATVHGTGDEFELAFPPGYGMAVHLQVAGSLTAGIEAERKDIWTGRCHRGIRVIVMTGLKESQLHTNLHPSTRPVA